MIESSRRVAPLRSRLLVGAAFALIATLAAAVGPSPIASLQPAAAASFDDCAPITDSVDRLYEAYFLRAPDDAGRSFWIDELQSGRLGLLEISDFFASSPEFRARYDSLSNGQFVQRMYRNVLGRGPDEAGFAFWADQLDDGTRSRGSVVLNFSESPEFVEATGTTPPLAGYFSWYPSGTTFACGADSFDHVTGGLANLDIFAEQRLSSDTTGGWVTLTTRSGEDSLVFSETYIPFGHLHLDHSTDPTPSADEVIRIEADPGIDVMVVSYPGETLPEFEERAGWRDGERAPTAGEFIGDLDAAVTITDSFWRSTWSDWFTGSYSSPTVTGLYDGNRPDAPFCATFQLLPDNAFYCPFDDSVAWDVSLMAEGYLFGDAWVYLVVAHEWGHAVQARIDPSLVWVGGELQADCFAGATLFGAAQNALFVSGADDSLVFEDGDQQELEAGLISLGDRTPWTESRSHGNAQQRVDAFELGRRGGVTACFPVDEPGSFRAPASRSFG